jgi:hypothetical protein
VHAVAVEAGALAQQQGPLDEAHHDLVVARAPACVHPAQQHGERTIEHRESLGIGPRGPREPVAPVGEPEREVDLVATQHVHREPAARRHLGPGVRDQTRTEEHQRRVSRHRRERAHGQTDRSGRPQAGHHDDGLGD